VSDHIERYRLDGDCILDDYSTCLLTNYSMVMQCRGTHGEPAPVRRVCVCDEDLADVISRHMLTTTYYALHMCSLGDRCMK